MNLVRTVAAGGLAAALAIGLSTVVNAASLPDVVADPTALVNTFIGTGSGGAVVGPVDMFPGAAAPFGMLTWSPDTTSRPASGGYSATDSATIGLSLTHAAGAGCGIAGDVPILPTVGDIGTNPTATTAPLDHTTEVAHPGSYGATIGSVGVDVAATTRTGIGTFTYPATASANMLFKVGDSQATMSADTVTVVGDDEVTGSITEGKFCDKPNSSTVYFAAKFDRPFAGYGTWTGSTVTPGSRTASATTKNSGAWVGFDTTSNPTVHLQVSVSYVSTADAEANIEAEQHGWNEAAVAERTRAQWRALLSEIQIGGGTHDQQVEFYTALYHALLDPSVDSDADGSYLGMDGQVHHTRTAQYTTFSGWDIYRSEVPLLAMVAPAQTSQMAQSLVNDAEQGGWLPKWPVAGAYTGMMGGDSADAIIAEAYAFGARDFDTRAALAAMVKGATQVQTADDLGQGYYAERPGLDSYLRHGYVQNTTSTDGSAVPDGASLTLEYATDDAAIAAFAHAIGSSDTYHTFLRRSQNWTSIFNVDSGFLQPRGVDGHFPAGNPVTDGLSDFGQSGFQEGNAAQYAWMVPQDLHGLITAMGGDAAAVSRLDTFFQQDNVGPNDPYYWAGNEVDLLAPWVYDYAGAPYKTQAEVHRLLDDVYSNSPGGEPGNDDLGAMSSWYVWGALGMYPETPGAPVLALGAPLFPVVRLHLPGHHATITAPGASDHGYVARLAVDGHTVHRDWLSPSDLSGRVDFTIANSPDTHWATAPGDEPPSYPAGRLTFPTGVVPTDVATDPADLTATADSSTPATLTFSVGVGAYGDAAAKIRQVHWTARPPAGVTVRPASGTATVSGGKATATVSFDVAGDAPQGFESVGFALSAEPAEPMPTVTVPLAVIGQGDTATICTTLGATNVDNGLTQREGGDGTTAPVTVGGESGRTTVLEVQNDLNMYFQVDPRIAHDGDFAASVTIEYYDTGTGSWQLQYDKHGGSAYTGIANVANTNTDTWKSVTISLPDAAVAEAENNRADFRIASGSPVIVHKATMTVSGTGVLPMNLCPSS
ncbi:MAG TPA: GH92 family glycosyl hydrolase [Pseudonocardiaceae bacterium]|jgi:predicted alpha-1,2-mannosidase|nr:GH92 family glycosyl hydrolase [Pseudonocardiaceae bacterium]